jgi:hypothetical protein
VSWLRRRARKPMLSRDEGSEMWWKLQGRGKRDVVEVTRTREARCGGSYKDEGSEMWKVRAVAMVQADVSVRIAHDQYYLPALHTHPNLTHLLCLSALPLLAYTPPTCCMNKIVSHSSALTSTDKPHSHSAETPYRVCLCSCAWKIGEINSA